jgi:hypothetical protein
MPIDAEQAELIAAKVAEKLGPGLRPKRLLTIAEAAAYIGRTEHAIRHMTGKGGRGGLPCVRTDRRTFLDVRDLDAWIDANKTGVDSLS